MTKLLHLLREEKAATAIEYGLIAALICIAALGAMQNFGAIADAIWKFVASSATAAMGPG